MHRRALSGLRVLAAVLLAVTLVLSPLAGVFGGPVGTADARHECTVGHSLFLSISNTADLTNNDLGCELFHGDTSTKSIDHNQTKTELTQRGATASQHNDLVIDTFKNNLQNSEYIARMEAQAAYYRALENGSSESAARIQAKDAVRDYYSAKQNQIAEAWNILIQSWTSYEELESNESLNNDFVQLKRIGSNTEFGDDPRKAGNSSVSTVNGSTVEAIDLQYGGQDGSITGTFTMNVANPSNGYTNQAYHLIIAHQTNNHTDVTTKDLITLHERWTQIEKKNNAVLSEIDTFINNTYDAYQSGDINATDIIDANTLERDFSSMESNDWATMALSLTEGVDPPKNMSNLDSITVSYQGSNYSGTLLADTEEVSNISVGSTYDGSTWNFVPKMITPHDQVDLNGNFTVERITDANGSTKQSLEYRTIKYNTTNTTEYRNMMEDLDALRAQLEQQQEARQSSSGIGFLYTNWPLSPGESALLAVGVAGAILIFRP